MPTAWQSDQIVLGTFFNGGLRAYDISNPYQPETVGIFVPPAPPGAPTGTIQLNDVFVDERGIVFYTNYTSAKSQQISRHPVASAVFSWLAVRFVSMS